MPDAAWSAIVPLHVEELGRDVLAGVAAPGEARRRADLGLLLVFADERPLLGLAGFIDWRTSGRLTGLLRSGLCTGELNESVLLPGRPNVPVDRIVLYGLGDSRVFDPERAAQVGGRVVELARDLRAGEVILAVPGVLSQREATESLFAAVAERLAQPRVPLDTRETDAVPALVPDPGEPLPPRAEPAPRTEPAPRAECWWAVAEPRLVQRLRRLLSGPPRAAERA